jgi:hypothetical protein
MFTTPKLVAIALAAASTSICFADVVQGVVVVGGTRVQEIRLGCYLHEPRIHSRRAVQRLLR